MRRRRGREEESKSVGVEVEVMIDSESFTEGRREDVHAAWMKGWMRGWMGLLRCLLSECLDELK